MKGRRINQTVFHKSMFYRRRDGCDIGIGIFETSMKIRVRIGGNSYGYRLCRRCGIQASSDLDFSVSELGRQSDGLDFLRQLLPRCGVP